MINLLIGLAAGFFGGLVGLGGGVIMIPLMVGVLKMGQHKAHGTSLVALVFTGISGAFTYASNGSVDLLASLLLASTAIFTARAGARFANALPEWKLKRSFGGFLILISLLLLLKPYLYHVADPATGWLKISVLLSTGVFTGFLSGMMGVGGGTIMVPSMVLLIGFTQYAAQGCSLLAMVPVGIVGAYTHWRLGNVSTSILPGLIPGILLGTYLGGSLAHILTEEALRIIFAAVLIWTGAKYLITPRPSPDKEPTAVEKTEKSS
ncbi:sulfite exporter TauE/SafE family protein [Desulfoscipio sp. XC116]|uniref:sulfite exporter TauE/SafE family protein n=1 Tax=Desulfoscipio sp. XC116 TaxID=3144975 RepID=UPI00325B387B